MLHMSKSSFCESSVSLAMGGSWKAALAFEGSVSLCFRSQQLLGRSRSCPLAPRVVTWGYVKMNGQERLCLKESGVH